ncbi:MAG: cell division protein ZapA [Bacteroidales bacterium]
MTLNELTISVTLADRPYRLKIQSNEEEMVRKAASKINEMIKQYSSSYAFNDKQDLLAMVVLDQALEAMRNGAELDKTQQSIDMEVKAMEEVLGIDETSDI